MPQRFFDTLLETPGLRFSPARQRCGELMRKVLSLRSGLCIGLMAATGLAAPFAWAAGGAKPRSGETPVSLPAEPTGAGRPKVSDAPSAPAEAASVPNVVYQQWLPVPRVVGQLGPRDVGLVINTNDPYSVRVGEYYAKARGLQKSQILHVKLPITPALSRGEFAQFSRQVDAFYGDRVQALALAWRLPYAVDCNSITGALTTGFDPKLCDKTCSPSRASRYFGSTSTRPYRDFGMRLSMLLAAPSFESAKALIDRGVKSDGTLGLRGAPPTNVHMVATSDEVRSLRKLNFPPPGPEALLGFNVILDKTDALKDSPRVLMYLTGKEKVEHLDTIDFVPGALADHLTSYGGALDDPKGQMSVLSWIDAGVTATYGTTSEPCAHWQKFPHPQVLLLTYAYGATAIESYWKSVLWPQQGLFVGEPLAAPFGRATSRQAAASR